MAKSDLEATLEFQMRALKVPAWETEYMFSEYGRKWRFDFAWPRERFAVEAEGGVWSGGRHVRGKGYEGDLEKYNAAALEGWCVLRFTGNMIKSGKAASLIAECLT